MWKLLFLFFPVAATLWAMLKMRGIRVKERKAIIFALLLLCVGYFGIQDYLITRGHYPFVGGKFLHDFSATLMVPLAHLFFCYSLGITAELKYMRILCFMCVFMIPELFVAFNTPDGVDYALITDHFNYLHVQFSPDFELYFSAYTLVVAGQIIVEAQRIMVLRRIFKRRELFFTRAGRLVLHCTSFTAVWIFVTLLPSHEYLHAHPLAMTFIQMVYCFMVTVMFVMVTLFFNNEVVVDVDEKPVALEHNTDVDLAIAIREVVESQKIYLNSNLHIDDLAAMVSSNRTYVARVCRNKFNMTFTELMNHYRIDHAKGLLLADERKRMEDIAAESGFSSSSFFARVFKQHEGMTPSQWRQHEWEVREKKTAEVRTLHEGMTTEEALMDDVDEVNEMSGSRTVKVNIMGG